MGCWPVLDIDSCHLSGLYKGVLLSTISYDVDDEIFFLALGAVSSENYDVKVLYHINMSKFPKKC